ncbi:methyltransferase domain-containing protein [Candidatus Sumerlaeota bacterium]|nr:methyltransferase domain-containing protein [Candidatus Sumerlaeota bacterium]
MDARKKLPFSTESVDFIFCEHFIEHLTKQESISFLKECFRILVPGGVIRIGWPELSNILNAYFNSAPESWDTGNPESETVGDKLNDSFFLFGHRYIYDYQTLELVMGRIGYTNFQKVEWGKSKFKELNGLERNKEFKIHVIEAVKPE